MSDEREQFAQQAHDFFYDQPWLYEDSLGEMWRADANKAVFNFAADFAIKLREAGRLSGMEQAAQKWIPVSERVPEDYCQILIYGEGVDEDDDAYYQITEVRWDVDEHFRIETEKFKVTHWMPLPEPPAIREKIAQEKPR